LGGKGLDWSSRILLLMEKYKKVKAQLCAYKTKSENVAHITGMI
jgi:hypothetical protein